MNQIPVEIKAWFDKVTEECWEKAEDETSRNLISHKVEHTMRVVKYGARIMEREPLKWNYEQGLVVCLLHDIGRFPQALMGSLVDQKTLNHAEKGRMIFEKADLKLESFKGNKGEIAEAIGEHNNPNYEGENMYVYLAANADQLAIMEELDWQTIDNGEWCENTGKIRNILRNKFLNGEVLNTKEAESIGDWMLCVRSWEKRFKFKVANEIYTKEGFGEKLRERYTGMFPEEKENAELFAI